MVPSENEWLIKCHGVMSMEKLTAIRRLRAGKLSAMRVYENRWGNFIRHWSLRDISLQMLYSSFKFYCYIYSVFLIGCSSFSKK